MQWPGLVNVGIFYKEFSNKELLNTLVLRERIENN